MHGKTNKRSRKNYNFTKDYKFIAGNCDIFAKKYLAEVFAVKQGKSVFICHCNYHHDTFFVE
jgi:predicted phosphodiesterase